MYNSASARAGRSGASSAVAVVEGGERRAGPGASRARPFSLDHEASNSRPGTSGCVIVPGYSGGWMDPQGGKSKRIAWLKRFEALGRACKRPVMLTLTLARTDAGPEADYDRAFRRVSRLLSEVLGLTVWGRVSEVQTRTGAGWIHWHILVDLGGTRWEGPGGWLRLKEFNEAAWEAWNRQWGLGSVDTQLLKSKRGAASYMVKYLVKGWDAIPTWILTSDRNLRLVGMSKQAGRLVRAALGLPEPVSQAPVQPTGLLGQVQEAADRRGRKKRRPLLDRLAASGLFCKVLQWTVDRAGEARWQFVGTLPVPWMDVLAYKSVLPHVECMTEERESPAGRSSRAVLTMTLDDDSIERARRRLGQVLEPLRRLGAVDRARRTFAERRVALLESWWRNQAE